MPKSTSRNYNHSSTGEYKPDSEAYLFNELQEMIKNNLGKCGSASCEAITDYHTNYKSTPNTNILMDEVMQISWRQDPGRIHSDWKLITRYGTKSKTYYAQKAALPHGTKYNMFFAKNFHHHDTIPGENLKLSEAILPKDFLQVESVLMDLIYNDNELDLTSDNDPLVRYPTDHFDAQQLHSLVYSFIQNDLDISTALMEKKSSFRRNEPEHASGEDLVIASSKQNKAVIEDRSLPESYTYSTSQSITEGFKREGSNASCTENNDRKDIDDDKKNDHAVSDEIDTHSKEKLGDTDNSSSSQATSSISGSDTSSGIISIGMSSISARERMSSEELCVWVVWGEKDIMNPDIQDPDIRIVREPVVVNTTEKINAKKESTHNHQACYHGILSTHSNAALSTPPPVSLLDMAEVCILDNCSKARDSTIVNIKERINAKKENTRKHQSLSSQDKFSMQSNTAVLTSVTPPVSLLDKDEVHIPDSYSSAGYEALHLENDEFRCSNPFTIFYDITQSLLIDSPTNNKLQLSSDSSQNSDSDVENNCPRPPQLVTFSSILCNGAVDKEYGADNRITKKVVGKSTAELLTQQQQQLLQQGQQPLEVFCHQIKNQAIHVLKLNRENKWQSRYLTISKEGTWLNTSDGSGIINGNNGVFCPFGILWAKRFNLREKEHSITEISPNGNGGMLLSQMKNVKRANNCLKISLSKKQDKFVGSTIIRIYRRCGVGNSADFVTFRCTKVDAAGIIIGCNAMMDVLRSSMKNEMGSVASGDLLPLSTNYGIQNEGPDK